MGKCILAVLTCLLIAGFAVPLQANNLTYVGCSPDSNSDETYWGVDGMCYKLAIKCSGGVLGLAVLEGDWQGELQLYSQSFEGGICTSEDIIRFFDLAKFSTKCEFLDGAKVEVKMGLTDPAHCE